MLDNILCGTRSSRSGSGNDDVVTRPVANSSSRAGSYTPGIITQTQTTQYVWDDENKTYHAGETTYQEVDPLADFRNKFGDPSPDLATADDDDNNMLIWLLLPFGAMLAKKFINNNESKRRKK